MITKNTVGARPTTAMNSSLAALRVELNDSTINDFMTGGILNKVADQILYHLKEIVRTLGTIGNGEPFAIAFNNNLLPLISRSDLIDNVQDIINLINKRIDDFDDVCEENVGEYVRRLEYLRAKVIPELWGNPSAVVPACVITFDGLRRLIISSLKPEPIEEATQNLKRLSARVRGMESRIKDLEPRSSNLETMVDRIEKAYLAADQLPADMDLLEDARKNISVAVEDTKRDREFFAKAKIESDELGKLLLQHAKEAEAVVNQCQLAYSAATSVGLAAAFAERSKALSKSMWAWVVGLIIALVTGGYFGSKQLHSLAELIKVPNASPLIIFLNIVLSLFSVAAPVWFAWLATKQIGQRFKLAEDYAFKASISSAYEGFRREAARFDKDMEARLLSSALTRLDELPLRLVDDKGHGSPWHELASSDLVREAVKAVPGFAEQVKASAAKALDAISLSKKTASSTEKSNLQKDEAVAE